MTESDKDKITRLMSNRIMARPTINHVSGHITNKVAPANTLGKYIQRHLMTANIFESFKKLSD